MAQWPRTARAKVLASAAMLVMKKRRSTVTLPWLSRIDSTMRYGAQVLPLGVLSEPLDFLGDPVTARFGAAMPALAGFQIIVRDARETARLRIFQEAFHLLMQGALVAFERQHVIGPGRADLAGDLLLATHGIDGHDTAREVQRAQQLGGWP